MKISEMEVFALGDGSQVDPGKERVESLSFVRIRTDEGITGLSEAFCVPPGVAHAAMGGPDSYLGGRLIGEELTHPERLWTRLYESMMHANRRGWAVICLGAIDIALWDIYGKMLNQPVYQLLGGAERCRYQMPANSGEPQTPEVIPYCTIISDEYNSESMFAQQVERVVRLAELGYRGFKVEPMMSTPERVVELARRAREEIGAERMLAVDVGYAFNDVPTALRICRQLEEYDVFFFETPFPVDWPEAYAKLSAQTAVPLAMGEHGVTRWEFLNMMERGGVGVVQPYMSTCGGITEAKRIVDLARVRGALVCPGNWSTQALGTATVHLAAYSPISPFIEFAPAEIYPSPLRTALQELGCPVVDGAIGLPSRPGIGFDLPDDLIENFQVG